MRTLLCSLLMLSLAWTASAAVTRNDDSCDIALLPAATLLLPFFEVDLEDPDGSTTLFTITNVTHVEQIARLTLWTDYSYPVLAFNIYLTGYDVQSINLYDVIGRGIVAPDGGTGTALQKRGKYSDPNPSLQLEACDRLPGVLDTQYTQRLRQAFTEGTVPDLGPPPVIPGCNAVGNEHENAVGYATIDVVRVCADTMPDEARYWTHEIGYANALIGDYQHVRRGSRFADGGPMVHIRAVPEGGLTPPLFPRTFYSRFQSSAAPKLDARQPLPAVFAARWIAGGPTGYDTSLKIWREGRTGLGAPCSSYVANATIDSQEIVRFDEAENGVADVPVCRIICPPPPDFPSTSMIPVSDASIFPQLANAAVSGWFYLNLDQPSTTDLDASQAWVITSMHAEGQFSVDMDAAALGNGCSAAFGASEIGTGNAQIGPLPNVRSQQ